MSSAMRPSRRCVLVFAGLDPSGGAGLAADIAAISAQGAHALPVLTVLTAQDNNRVQAIHAIPAEQVRQQAEVLLASVEIAAIKLGIIGSLENARVIVDLLQKLRQQQPDLPMVLDPVLASGHGDALAQDDPCAIIHTLLPYASIILPNLPEASRLCPQAQGIQQQAAALQARGCSQVFIKGGHGLGDAVENHWFDGLQTQQSWRWPRILGEFHGSGCTLAAALAGQLACGQDMTSALRAAQVYTQQTLQQAYAIAPGQAIPMRHF